MTTQREPDAFAAVAQQRRRVAFMVLGTAAGVLVAALLFQLLFSDDRRRAAQILDAHMAGPSTLVLGISACNAGNNEVDVVERADEVVLTATTDDPLGGDDCADGVTVDLGEALADRRIVDGSTGAEVELSR